MRILATLIAATALLLAAGCGGGDESTTASPDGPLVTYSKSGGIAGIEERLVIEPDGSATVSTGPDGSQRSFALGADELSVLEAELEAADLDAVEDRPTGCADCFHYEISYGGSTVGYDEIIQPPQSVAAVASHLAALVDEHAPAAPVASEAQGSPGALT